MRGRTYMSSTTAKAIPPIENTLNRILKGPPVDPIRFMNATVILRKLVTSREPIKNPKYHDPRIVVETSKYCLADITRTRVVRVSPPRNPIKRSDC